MAVSVSPSAPGPEPVGAVLAGLDDDEALAGEGQLVGLAAAAPDQGGRLEAAPAFHLQVGGPGDEGVRVHERLVLTTAAVDHDGRAPGGQRDPTGTGDADVEQALAGELGHPLDPLHAPLEVRVEGEDVGAVDGERLVVEVDA